MDISKFTSNLSTYADYYSPTKLFSKIKNVAKKAGANVIFAVLVLYYATFDKDLPVKDRDRKSVV